jgi:hypothetical protein
MCPPARLAHTPAAHTCSRSGEHHRTVPLQPRILWSSAPRLCRALAQRVGGQPHLLPCQPPACSWHHAAASRTVRVRGEIMAPGKYANVGKSQSVLIMIKPMISPHTHIVGPRCLATAWLLDTQVA